MRNGNKDNGTMENWTKWKIENGKTKKQTNANTENRKSPPKHCASRCVDPVQFPGALETFIRQQIEKKPAGWRDPPAPKNSRTLNCLVSLPKNAH